MDRQKPDEITPPHLYFGRRTFIRAGIVAGGIGATALLYRKLNGVSTEDVATKALDGVMKADASAGFRVDEPLTPLSSITHYNNFYEFSTDKDGVAEKAAKFTTEHWKIDVGGLCEKPRTFDLDAIAKLLRRRVAWPSKRKYPARAAKKVLGGLRTPLVERQLLPGCKQTQCFLRHAKIESAAPVADRAVANADVIDGARRSHLESYAATVARPFVDWHVV